MTILMELIGEILLGALLEVARSSKVPFCLQFLFVGALVLFYGTLIMTLYIFSVVNRNVPVFLLALILFIVSMVWFFNTIKKQNNRK